MKILSSHVANFPESIHICSMNEGTQHFLKEWKKHRGLKSKDLAEAMDISTGYMSELERGVKQLNMRQLIAASDALGCQAWQLLAGPPTGDESQSEQNQEMAAKALAYLVHRIARRFADEGRDLSKEKPVYSEWWMDQYQSLLAISDVLDQLDGDLDALPKVLEAAGRADPRATNGK